MRKIGLVISGLAVSGLLCAQTLNVQVGNVLYQFPAVQTAQMPYDNGESLTIMGKTFALSEIDSMYIDETAVTDNAVAVDFADASAAITVAGNIAKDLTIAYSGAHVSIIQSADVAEEITYTLSGASSDGGFYNEGEFKATVELNNLNLTNVSATYSGAAVHIQNSKRIKIKPLTGTTNTLVDAASGKQKGCLYVKGHVEFAQKGTLNITGNVKHGIKTGEYFQIKNSTINILSSVGNGINCEQFFLMESGKITMTNVGDDGLQCDLEDPDTGSTGITTDHEDEDSGNVYISGGTFSAAVTADACKGLKSEGDMYISGGEITITTSGGGVWDATNLKAKAASCISADGIMDISGGTLTLTSTGAGGEGIESKKTLTVSDGHITVNAFDDGINCSSDMTINGGYIFVKGSKNDAMDANGNMYVKGGLIYAIGATSPEVALDANTEEGKKLYITGGTIIAVGNLEGGAQISGGTCKYTTSWNATSWYALYNGGELVAAFQTPSKTSSGYYAPGPGGGGSSQKLVVYTSSTPTLKSGVTVSDGTEYFGGLANIGGTVTGGTNVSLSNYSSGGGMGW